MNALGSILWLILGGILVALVHLTCGLLFCITIVGIPFGVKHFRLALSSIFPFGKDIVPRNSPSS
ncbi:MAG: hypothetical protein IJU74_09995 [Bacteroidales bacterium]|nr:hypothetical protein [Bacteroidales bacterium]